MNSDSFECTVPGCPCTRLVDEMIAPRPVDDDFYKAFYFEPATYECTDPECECSYKADDEDDSEECDPPIDWEGLKARLSQKQPAPVPNTQPAIWDLVFEDMGNRDELGLRRYGTRLQAHNGRDAMRDAYEEALDLVAYLRQAIFERDGR